jgi:hypothetical protein
MKRMRFFVFALLAPTIWGCNCGESGLSKIKEPDQVKLDAGLAAPDAEAAPDAMVEIDAGPSDSGVPEARVLKFNGTTPVTMYFGATRDLTFTLMTVSGVAVPSATIRFSYNGTGGSLSAVSTQTDISGIGSVQLTAPSTAGQATLTASADLAPEVSVPIVIEEDPSAILTLEVVSSARISVATADALVYVGAPGAVPTCAQLLATSTPPAPTFTASFTSLPGSSTFMNQMSGRVVTAFASGSNVFGRRVARGCTEGVRLQGGASTHVLVTLAQDEPNLDGNYDALLGVDIGMGLPPPLGPTIVLITDFLADPAGWAVYQVLAAADDQLGLNTLTWTPPGGTMERRATFEEVRANPSIFQAWSLARNAFDGFLRSQLGQTYVDVTTVGGDISHLVRGFEVGAGYTITSTGTPNRVRIDEQWQAYVFQWQYGCPGGDLGCARHAVSLTGQHANLAPATATYGASVQYTPTTMPAPGESERYTLQVDPHQITIRYGAIILFLLDELVFPNLPSGIAGNSLSAVLANIVNCPSVASSIEMSVGIPAQIAEAICDGAVSAGAMYIENQILMLDSSNTGLVVGLSPSGGGQMVLVDHDRDLSTELVESVTTYAEWSTGQTVASPITGAGRRRATHCALDANCPAPTVCTPIPSYLKVRAVENDCRVPAGMRVGPVACVQGSECASGLCFDSGSGNRICFTACNGAGSCAMGTCTQNAAAVNLDAVMMGLGNAHADACVP